MQAARLVLIGLINNISIENSLIPGLKHIIIRTSQSNIYDYKNVYHYEYDTMTGQFMNPYVNPLK